MPAASRTSCLLLVSKTPKPVLITRLRHRHLSVTSSQHSTFRRTDFQSQGYTGTYEPGLPTGGPLGEASKHGPPRLTPRLLKDHLDKFVVGQEKAKKVTSVAVFNHYQRIRELRRLDEEEQERREQWARRHLHERRKGEVIPLRVDEFPGHVETVDLNYSPVVQDEPELGARPLEDNSATIIEKSNLMLLGPSGVGKTYILQTLAKVLEVPFATVDCSSLTQAGYIGTDVESALERLLLASSYNLSKCESGIIFFDEVDKLAKPAVMTHGRDVSGEGVQQGLLKMIEGTTVTINAKGDRSSTSMSGARGAAGKEPPGKAEQYTIDTSNILFVFAGAFIGLEKIITSRLSTGSNLGFGSTGPEMSSKSLVANPLLSVTPADLQAYGIIPEMLGRIPILTSLSPLTLSQLVSILLEPRNSLVKQYTALLETYNVELRFTRLALEAIAERAMTPVTTSKSSTDKERKGNGLGARGLRSVMESVMLEIMYTGPSSTIKFVLIDEAYVRDHDSACLSEKDKEWQEPASKIPRVWSRGEAHKFRAAFDEEEEVWKVRNEKGKESEDEGIGSFEKMRSVGSSGM